MPAHAEAVAPCARCGKPTAHRRDLAGALHCVRCVIEDSIPPSYEAEPDEPEVEPTERLTLRLPVTAFERIAVGVIALGVGALIYALVVRRG